MRGQSNSSLRGSESSLESTLTRHCEAQANKNQSREAQSLKASSGVFTSHSLVTASRRGITKETAATPCFAKAGVSSISANGSDFASASSYEGNARSKIQAPLAKKESDIIWCKFKIGELFDYEYGDFDIQKKHINGKGEIVISAGETNNGIIGRSDVKAKIFKANTLTMDMFGFVFYRNLSYKMVTHARVCSLKFKDSKFSPKCMLYVVSTMSYLKHKFDFSNMATWNKVKDLEISLPIDSNNQIAFDFIESFIKAIEKITIKNIVLYNEKKLNAYKSAINAKT